MSIRLRTVEARVVDHPVRRDGAIISSLGRHEASRYATVVVTDADGVRGFGEATTAPIWSGETADTARWIVEEFMAPRLVGATFDGPAEALALMDATIHANPFAKAAIDVALWDLDARRRGLPVSSLIADREPRPWIPSRVSIGAYPPEEAVRLALEFHARGVRTLKFKTGKPDLDDIARLRAVREALGPDPTFTIDANGAYPTADAAVRAIEELLPFDLALVEQPTPRDRIGMLAEVRRRTPVPILVDEAVFTPGQLEQAIEQDAFDVLSIYPGKNGGFSHSLAMARRAQQVGKCCAIGSNLETDLGQAAMICLASSLSAFPTETHACDLMAALFYDRSATDPPIRWREGGVEAPTGPGFGVTPAEGTRRD